MAVTLDYTVLAVAYAIGVGFLLLGYVFAGPVWVERHSIQLAGPGHTRRVSGFWGEWALFTGCAAVAATVRAFTDTAIVADVILPHALISIGVFAGVLILVLLYASSVVAGAKRDGKEKTYTARLRAAYFPYAIYSAVIFAGGIMVLALLVTEFVHDQQSFNAQARVVTQAVTNAINANHAPIDPSEAARHALTYLEDAMGNIAVSQNILQNQMNPVFIFAAVIFAVNILIVLSPIRTAFMQGAIDLTHILTAIAVGGVILAGFVSYFLSYSVVIQDMLTRMEGVRPAASLGAWELSQRFNEMVVELNRSKNLLGFVQAVGGEGSGLALFAGAIQFTLDRIPSREQRKAEA
jgi:hypothetical protein